MKAIISEKGQITIPAVLRDQLGLRTGQVIDFEVRGTLLVGRKADDTSKAEKVRGYLKKRVRISVDEYIDDVRGR